MSKTSLDPDYIPILKYVRKCLEAKGWKVYDTDGDPKTQVTLYARRRLSLRQKVALTIQIAQPTHGEKFYLTKFQIFGFGTELCNIATVLAQYSKTVHPLSEGQLRNLWAVENGLSVSKLFECYDRIASDLGYPKLFQGKQNN